MYILQLIPQKCITFFSTAQQIHFRCILWACLVCLQTFVLLPEHIEILWKVLFIFYFCQLCFVEWKALVSDEILDREQRCWMVNPLREHLCLFVYMWERVRDQIYDKSIQGNLLCYVFFFYEYQCQGSVMLHFMFAW